MHILTLQVFGLGCGSNNDMSVDGAALWMAGISAASIAQANYYTTVYDKGGPLGQGYCNMLTNAMLVCGCVCSSDFVGEAQRRHNRDGVCHALGRQPPLARHWPVPHRRHELARLLL